jgi:hypothetical protein
VAGNVHIDKQIAVQFADINFANEPTKQIPEEERLETQCANKKAFH